MENDSTVISPIKIPLQKWLLGFIALEHIDQGEVKFPNLTKKESVLAVIAVQPGLFQFSNNLFGKNVFLKHCVL